jgi:hypothetical protein
MQSSGPGLGRQAGEVIKAMVNENCFARLGEERGYDQRPDVQRLLYLARQYIVSTEAIRLEVWDKVEPNDAEIEEFYAQNQDRFRMRAKVWYHEILCDSETQARGLRERLLAGEDFAQIATAHSIDRTAAERGGEMPPYEQGLQGARLDELPELVQLLFRLEPQAISEPLRTARGWHIVRVDGRREDRLAPLDEVREEIRQTLAMKREGTRYQAVLDSLALAYGLQTFEEPLERFTFLQMDDGQLFEFARDEKDPARRVRAYENLLERFPASARAPEALFMIGFEKAEKIGDTPGALATFERFLEAYPQHEMSASARTLVEELRGRQAGTP